MQGLQKLLAQLGPRKLALMGAVVAVLLAGIAALSWRGSSEMGFLYTDLDPSAAQTISEKLKAQNVEFTISPDGKAIMAPNVAIRRDGGKLTQAQMAAEVRRMFMEIRRKVEDNCDYVGGEFAAEARRIHYGEADDRGIYGEATPDEAEALREAGIDVAAIPWLPRSDA